MKDAFHQVVVGGRADAANPEGTGTKAAAHLQAHVEPGETWTVRLRLTVESAGDPFDGFEEICAERESEADAFYATVIPSELTDDEKLVMRQALGGMLWSKQFYLYDVGAWLRERGVTPFSNGRVRNSGWFHMENADIFSMPDTWEYPWYASWDLAFHCAVLALVDPEFAKHQLELVLGSGTPGSRNDLALFSSHGEHARDP